MMRDFFVKQYPLGTVDKTEVFRYMGVKTPDEKTEQLADECIAEFASDAHIGKVCFCYCDTILHKDGVVDLSFCSVESNSLSKHLRGCDKAVVFSATIGIGIDRLIQKHMRLSPARALCFEAIGNAQIESLCDVFCDELQKDNPTFSLTSRFSPGYGDLSLEVQKSIFATLDCPKRTGLTLTDSLLMTPSKAVTAIVGLKTKE